MDFTHTKIRLGRPLLSYAKAQSFLSVLVSPIVRNSRLFADFKQPGCYLDLGCGRKTSSDVCNLDFDWWPGVDVCWDVRRGLPFPDQYVAGIFTEHMLEHVNFDDGLALLAECRRILRPGGILRIVMPDGEIYLRGYANGAALPELGGEEAFPFRTPMVRVNQIFRSWGHRFIWDYETLAAGLSRAGFVKIDRVDFGRGRDPKLLRDTQDRRPGSLYVEAS